MFNRFNRFNRFGRRGFGFAPFFGAGLYSSAYYDDGCWEYTPWGTRYVCGDYGYGWGGDGGGGWGGYGGWGGGYGYY